jgi:TetR/AcrR family tetracycline transcriptional repressor
MALTRQRIVAEAVALLDSDGLDGVTLRRLATRLGIQAPTLYWHLPNKAALITAIAEVVIEQEFGAPSGPAADERWQDWLVTLAQRLRRAMLAHPDGARVISTAQLSLRMAELSELAMSSLVSQGLTLRRARLVVLAVEHLTIGFVLEEQAPHPDLEPVAGHDLATFTERYPTVTAAIADYFQPGVTVDDLFTETVRLIVEPPHAP